MCLYVDEMRDERKEEEAFLHGVYDGITDDIAFVERGGVPMNWSGCPKVEILLRLRRHQVNVSRAIQHIRDGGSLTDIVPIVWGLK